MAGEPGYIRNLINSFLRFFYARFFVVLGQGNQIVACGPRIEAAASSACVLSGSASGSLGLLSGLAEPRGSCPGGTPNGIQPPSLRKRRVSCSARIASATG